jgi:probable rRNA maturation factor
MQNDTKSRNHMPDRFFVSVANEQSGHPVNEDQLIAAVKVVVCSSSFTSATVSIAVVDDHTMHELNRRHLNHDWPTDVLSFVLEDEGGHLEGEVVISADTAARAASEVGWSPSAEQLLYAIHGTLHLVGFRDKSAAEQAKMRAAEAAIMDQFGFRQPTRRGANKDARTPTPRTRGATAL